MDPHDIKIDDFNYELPEQRIPKYPLDKRDTSKLLVYANGEIRQTIFSHLDKELAPNATLIFNDSRVIPVRLFFETPSGHSIEVFCLEQHEVLNEKTAVWKCFVGRLKKWSKGNSTENPPTLSKKIENKKIEIDLIGRASNYCFVQISWNQHIDSIFDAFELFGNIPIPPYLNRETEEIDKERYQNVFAHNKGSVAAPTAGLHFTDSLINKLKTTGTKIDFVTLHVGAGTFKPVQSETLGGHEMHMERMFVNRKFIENFIAKKQKKENITAVGTTTLRTLESIFWLGVKLNEHNHLRDENLIVNQWLPYEKIENISTIKSLQIILDFMTAEQTEVLSFSTELLILPSYKFRMIDTLMTNFHQPKSTLLLLVAAAIGEDWKLVYKYALKNDFRFLSYGDSSLIHIPAKNKAKP